MNTTNTFRGEFEVTVKGKIMKGAFTMNALRLVLREEKIKLEKFDKYMSEDPLTAIPTLGYFSVVSECIKAGKKCTISKEQFIAEGGDNGGMEIIAEAVSNSLGSTIEDKEGK